MTGHEDACVDDEGWYYAVDFNWLKHPPAPGSGRFKRVSRPDILCMRIAHHRKRSAERMISVAFSLPKISHLHALWRSLIYHSVHLKGSNMIKRMLFLCVC
jgi:hypothetical protein